MPEIAEVQVVRAQLDRLRGRTLTSVEIHDRKLAGSGVDTLTGATLTGTVRHGKRLGLLFGERVLACHLRMTGALLYGTHPRARALLRFTGEDRYGSLSFVDARRFGTLAVTPGRAFAAGAPADLLAAAPDELTAAARVAARSRRPVKAVLLDQRLAVAGIGNYLADEAVGRAGGVHPAQRACTLTVTDWRRLLGVAQAVAVEALSRGGVSMRDYVHPDGSRGDMQNHLRFYGRAGLPCPTCTRPLERAVIAGRASTFCPACAQPLAG